MMDIAIEKGLNARKVKVGDGEKTPAYAINKSKLKSFIFGVFGLALLLFILALGYFRLFLNEKQRNEILTAMNRHSGRSQANTIRLGVALQAALNEDDGDDHVRTLTRILHVVRRELDSATADNKDHEAIQSIQKAKYKIESYIQQEISDLQEEMKASSKERKERLHEVSKMQEHAIRNILSSVSGVRLQALDDMLEDIFSALKETTKGIYIPREKLSRLDHIVDKMYEESITMSEAMNDFNDLMGNIDLPQEIRSKIANAQTIHSLADIFDDISESSKINSGRTQLEKIRDVYMAKKEAWKGKHESDRNKEERSEFTVEAIAEVQKLVNDGVIPMEFLDFSDLNLGAYGEDADVYEEDSLPRVGYPKASS